MKLAEIYVRDPFILPFEGSYYLYAKIIREDSKFVVYKSQDLENWSGPEVVFQPDPDFWGKRDFWAPEVHCYNGKFYMFASFKAEGKCRGTHVLISDHPQGPFYPVSSAPATPADWECLDGTLYVDKNGNPYMVFCHEWLQIGNGTMCYARLGRDLAAQIEKPTLMFSAHDYPFVVGCIEGRESYVTDGPFLHRCQNDDLLMIWSSFGKNGYFIHVQKSDNGEITGQWLPQNMLFSENGGHGMLFRTFDGKLKLVFHSPNDIAGAERAKIVDILECDGSLRINE